MTHQSSPLPDSDVLDCLRTDVVPSSAEAKRRVSTRLSVSVGALLSAAAPTPSVETTSAPHVQPPGVARNWSRLLARRPWGFTIATFSIGAVCGAGMHAALHDRTAPGVTQAVQAVTAPSSAVTREDEPKSVVPPGIDPSADPLAEGVSRRATPSRPAASGMSNLAEQQTLLDQARAALARGDHLAALQAVELHRRRYPNGIMTEEREALAIKALAGKGNYAEARARGARFRERFPHSLLLASIEETLATIP